MKQVKTGKNAGLRRSLELTGVYTAISRKVFGKNVHATIPKGDMGYDQYTVHNVCSYRTYFCCFPLALASICPWPVGLQCHSFKFLWITVHSRPPTTPFGIVACTFSDNLSRNNCMGWSCATNYRSIVLRQWNHLRRSIRTIANQPIYGRKILSEMCVH